MLGVLWMDDSQSEVTNKVQDAARRYHVRFGHAPTLCYANPKDVPEPIMVGSVRVEPRVNIRPHHFLVGCDTRKKEAQQAA